VGAQTARGGVDRASKPRDANDPLRVAVVVSGGNPDPAQLESVRARVAAARRTS